MRPADGTLFTDLGVSLGRTFGGLAIAAVGGILLGIAMARTRAVDWLLDPLVALGFPAPKIAFLPVFAANVIFAKRFASAEHPAIAFATNLLGAMLGGGLEYLALAFGYRSLSLRAAGRRGTP